MPPAGRPTNCEPSAAGRSWKGGARERADGVFCAAGIKRRRSKADFAPTCHMLRKKMQALAGAPHSGAALLRRKFGAAKGGGELRRANSFRPSIWITGGWRRLSAARTQKRRTSYWMSFFFGAVEQSKSEPVFISARAVLRSSKVMVSVPSL